jgi:flagellin FlaB
LNSRGVRLSWRDQRGITGLETAIVLIAFVVVSSVFAFAALSTGLFSSDKVGETHQPGCRKPGAAWNSRAR